MERMSTLTTESRNDLHLTSTGVGHAVRETVQFPPPDFKVNYLDSFFSDNYTTVSFPTATFPRRRQWGRGLEIHTGGEFVCRMRYQPHSGLLALFLGSNTAHALHCVEKKV